MNTRIFQNPVSKSLALHGFLFLIALFYITELAKPFHPADPIEVTFVDQATKAQEKKKAEDEKSRHVVQRSEGKEVSVAKKDSYLSEKTKVVEEERSARNSGGLTASPAQVQHEAKPALPKPVTLSDLGVKLTPKVKQVPYEEERHWANTQTGEAVQGGEYVKGLKAGEVSALNTKEFIFFSYFDRVRRQLDQVWPLLLRENIAHIFKVGRRLASNSDFTTRTLITLNTKGEVVKVEILEESGTRDLDQAAIDALNKAGPYPNPPKALIDPQGLVQIRWDFILKT